MLTRKTQLERESQRREDLSIKLGVPNPKSCIAAAAEMRPKSVKISWQKDLKYLAANITGSSKEVLIAFNGTLWKLHQGFSYNQLQGKLKEVWGDVLR